MDFDLRTRIEALPCGTCETMSFCENCFLQKEADDIYGQIIMETKEKVIDEIINFIGFRNLDDWSQRYIKAKDLLDKLNELKRG